MKKYKFNWLEIENSEDKGIIDKVREIKELEHDLNCMELMLNIIVKKQDSFSNVYGAMVLARSSLKIKISKLEDDIRGAYYE